jgi:phosphate transport system substrate-binding protein
MNGVMPTYETISNFTYPGARPLYIYVKKAHLKAIPGLQAYVTEWTKLWSKGGVLAKAGMVVAPDEVLAASAKAASELPVLDGAQLK